MNFLQARAEKGPHGARADAGGARLPRRLFRTSGRGESKTLHFTSMISLLALGKICMRNCPSITIMPTRPWACRPIWTARVTYLLLSVVESDWLLDRIEPLLEFFGKTLGFHIYCAMLELVRLVVVVRGAHNMLREGQNSFERQSRLAAKALKIRVQLDLDLWLISEYVSQQCNYRESLVGIYEVLLHVFCLGEGSLTAEMVHQRALK